MERELLLEIGTEELPASWLPALTRQIRDGLDGALRAHRLPPDAAVEGYATPRRLTARIAKIAERQADLEELITGPPVAAAFGADGTPTPAAVGFARKNSIDVALLEPVETPKGAYLGYRKHQRGKAAVDVLPDVLAATLRSFSFPKAMHWDAFLEDGKGDLLFGRPIRWILYLYGGRVVPFTIRRTELAESSTVQEIVSAAVTYGHRFLTTSGRAGRAVKVRTFDDYRDRLAEHFVILDRRERQDRIARGLEAKARSLGGRVGSAAAHHSTLLDEVPDLIEYPTVMAGTFSKEFLSLPEEVLTTTMIHHQHNFPVVDDAGQLKPAFLVVTNTDAGNEKNVARNYERVLSARLRDARFFWDADRTVPLHARIERLKTIRFHKKLGTYFEKAERIERLARWIAAEALASPAAADAAATAGRLAKADLATEMVAELTELQGVMGGIYAREEGQPERVWKAMYYHYLPDSVGADAPPSRQQLGDAAVVWAAVSLADKLDTVVGMFFAGEKPTGSRDPFGLRRQAHGIFKVLVDLTLLTGLSARPSLDTLLAQVASSSAPLDQWPAENRQAMDAFLLDRYRYVLEQRGFDVRNVRAVLQEGGYAKLSPFDALKRLEALPEFTVSPDFQKLAVAFKRVKNIARELPDAEYTAAAKADAPLAQLLKEPAEIALLEELERRAPAIDSVLESGENLRRAFVEAAQFGPAVDRFFTEIFVMVEDLALRKARLRLMKRLEQQILRIADISEIVSETE
ncbi:MAG TPA: glycine--tRNA ligase subunit beta [Vicinamibacterales bacterium]|nr:glycine--tRNA ligase subunit beta [Vicinamibacterales bacterium]